jgi:hypothetical protein
VHSGLAGAEQGQSGRLVDRADVDHSAFVELGHTGGELGGEPERHLDVHRQRLCDLFLGVVDYGLPQRQDGGRRAKNTFTAQSPTRFPLTDPCNQCVEAFALEFLLGISRLRVHLADLTVLGFAMIGPLTR